MFPTLYESGGLAFHSWGLMVMLAFLGACLVTSARARRIGIDSDKLVPMYLLVTIAGLGGARLLHFTFAEPEAFFANPLIYFDASRGGFAFVGGVIGGVGSGAIYARVVGVPVWKLADIAAAAIMLGLAIGRMGCFLAGCCHGRACPLPADQTLLELPGGLISTVEGFPFLALTFKAGVGVGNLPGIALYPTQIWAITGGLLLFALLSAMWHRARLFDGQILAAMLVGYAGLRMSIEQFRGDTIRGLHEIGGVTLATSEIWALVFAGLAILITALRLRKGRAPETAPQAPGVDDLLDEVV